MEAAEQLDDVFVGGYLVIYANQDDAGEEYRLPREVAARALPVEPGRIPVNINHNASCRVGSTIAVVDVEKGLFFLGAVSGSLAPVMFKYVERDLFPASDGASTGEGAVGDFPTDDATPAQSLSEQEKFLYLLSNVLPSLSLSSARLANGDPPAGDFFAHVALCELGKRDGTIAIYGSSPSEVLDAFSGLDGAAKQELERSAEAWTTSSRREEPVDEAMVSDGLLRKFMNNAFLMDRGEYLRARRHLADVRRPKYLQAAETICLSAANSVSGGEAEFPCEMRDPSAAGGGVDSSALESGGCGSVNQPAQESIKMCLDLYGTQIAPVAMNSASQQAGAPYSDARADPAAQVPSVKPPNTHRPPTGLGDMIYVPLETYNDLVVSAAQTRRSEDHRQPWQRSAQPTNPLQHSSPPILHKTGINSSSPAQATADRCSYDASAGRMLSQPAVQTQQPCWLPQQAQQQYVSAPPGGNSMGYYGQTSGDPVAVIPGTAPQLLFPQAHQAPVASPMFGMRHAGPQPHFTAPLHGLPTGFPVHGSFLPAPGYLGAVPPIQVYAPQPPQHPLSLDARIEALLSVLEKERASGQGGAEDPQQSLAAGQKKKRPLFKRPREQLAEDEDEDEPAPEVPYFPGEAPVSSKRPLKRARLVAAEGEEQAAPSFSDLIQGLAALHKDVAEMKASVTNIGAPQTTQPPQVTQPEPAEPKQTQATVDASSSRKLKESKRAAEKRRAADEFARIMSTD